MFNGVTLGSTYALIAIGYTMVYGIIGMINFAHGEVYMIGSYVSFMIIAALMMMGIDTSWLLVVLSLFVINRLLRMPLGRAWEALREDEIACRSLGLSPTRIKLTAFTISAAFAGFAGTLFAARQGFVSPESFTFAESAFVLAIVVLGGMGSQFAVILAAILLVVSRELMRDFNEYSMLMLGGLMVLMMIWRPQGLLPMTRVQLKLKNGQAKGEQA
ncbi:hypothetical protein FNE71_10495 [Klebsiella pneumoniae]|nr:hypothetical protein FNE65_10130 [Klebsiella pneumoniae]KAB1720657.1 hypothetical protein FNE63_11830 [Klebsiella pneumoniae]KAB1749080.1 hypothetical protein FNE71_10495 [Klebsiella pneumoniae]MCJ4457923.1 hypothetical protein [Klebsiella pneumoniae]MCJ4468830.1 hypothetical protein [Klebsiella pneumoniae]